MTRQSRVETKPRRARIYLASSWRNPKQAAAVADLRAAGHEVYDFKNPKPGDTGFSWKQCDPEGPGLAGRGLVSLATYRRMLDHPRARDGFQLDLGGMSWATVGVLLLPCGRSAHLELGWLIGKGRKCYVLADDREEIEPELMYLLAREWTTPADDIIKGSMAELLTALE